MTATTRKTTPTTGPGGNGRYKTKMERSLAILRDKGTIPLAVFREEYLARHGDVLGDDTSFYRARKQIQAERFKAETVAIEAREESTPNVTERPTGKPAPKKGQPAVATDSTWTVSTEIPGRMAYVAVTKAPEGSRPLRRPALLNYLDGTLMSVRTPILSLAASMGGLLALRRAVDELIGGLAPELREEKS